MFENLIRGEDNYNKYNYFISDKKDMGVTKYNEYIDRMEMIIYKNYNA